MDDPTSVEGSEAVVVWLNEARLVRDFGGDDGAWKNLTRRLGGSGDRARYAIADTHSPRKDIMEAFKARKVRRVHARGATYEVGLCHDLDRRYYQWTTGAAVQWRTLSRRDGERIMAAYTGSAAARVLEGRYAAIEGAAYKDYDEARHLRKYTPLRGHSYYGGIDWGWDVTALVVTADTGSIHHSCWERGLVHSGLDGIHKAMLDAEALYPGIQWYGLPDRPESTSDLKALGHRIMPAKPSRVMDGVGIQQSDLQQGEWLIDPALVGLRQDVEETVMNQAGDGIDKDAYDPHYADAHRGSRVMVRRRKYARVH